MGGLNRGETMVVMGACFALLLQSAFAATYTVGGNSGWTIPAVAGNSQLYTSWISGKTFKVGDELEFNFTSGAHDVTQVTKSNYDSCGTASPIASYRTPPVKITLNETGAHYYICSFTGHCTAGQKIAVTVAASASPPKSSPAPSPSSPPPSATTPPPSSAATPPPAESPNSRVAPASESTPSPVVPTSSPSTNNDNNNNSSSASRLTASLGILSGVAALYFL